MNDDGVLEKPYKLIKANTGGISFTVTSLECRGQSFCFHLLKMDCSHEPAYTILLSENSHLLDFHLSQRKKFVIPNFDNDDEHEYWVTWYNDAICLGKMNEPALLTYSEVNRQMIGFVKFETSSEVSQLIDWNVESPPVIYSPLTKPKRVSGGKLRWVKMRSYTPLPIDALIGGLENEPLYIARAEHRGSLCPGKYVKSQQVAYIPWGSAEIEKNEFEILCGYDAMWVKSGDNRVPENALIAGYSDVRNEPLFIGRTWIRNNLVVGKVHVLYKTCYVPFRQREVERKEYETLVVANTIPRGETVNSVSHMNMQPFL